MTTSQSPLLRVEGVSKQFPVGRGEVVHAVDDVSLEIAPGETLSVVGESGCGKSTLARLITWLTPVSAGRIELDGRDVTSPGRSERRAMRKDVQLIFQDPAGSLDPRQTVEQIVGEPLVVHGVERNRRRRRDLVVELLERCGMSAAALERYPGTFSGGQQQRIGIARALALRPRLIVCDEPVSALDVSVQATILNLLKDLQAEFGLSYLFISHDLGVVRHISDRVAVMYLGRMVEVSPSEELYAAPRHPYTRVLLDAATETESLSTTAVSTVPEGDVPSPIDPPSGCHFHPRCPRFNGVAVSGAQLRCADEAPPIEGDGHRVACWLPWPAPAASAAG